MQGGHYLRLGPGQLAAKYLREEVVIAEPLPSVIERHDEEIFPLERSMISAASAEPTTASHSGAQNRLENRGAQRGTAGSRLAGG